jgi:hypothetical protein
MDGWKLVDADKCVEVDACETSPCAFHAICHKQPNAQYYCECPPGFIGDGTTKCEADPNAIDNSQVERVDYREKTFDQDSNAVEGELERVEKEEDNEHDAAQDYRLGAVKEIESDVRQATDTIASTVQAQDNTLRVLAGGR